MPELPTPCKPCADAGEDDDGHAECLNPDTTGGGACCCDAVENARRGVMDHPMDDHDIDGRNYV